MCGIFGVLSGDRTTSKAMDDFLYDALQTGQLRGVHGTGVVGVKAAGTVHHLARAVIGTEFLSDGWSGDILKEIPACKLVIGHNRQTTQGQNIDEHCHPFKYDNVVGVHNGTVGSWVCDKIDPDESHPVDSARIYAALDKADDPVEVLKKINSGAYALVWYDTRTESLYFARNDQRPMYMAETTKGLLWASELGMLQWLMARNKVTYDGVSFSPLDTHALYRIPLNDTSAVEKIPYEPDAFTNGGTYKYPKGGWGSSLGSWDSWDDDLYDWEPKSRAKSVTTSPSRTGSGHFGGDPAPVTYKRYYSFDQMITDFPLCRYTAFDAADYLYPVPPTGWERKGYMIALGIGVDYDDNPCVYGLLTAAPDDVSSYVVDDIHVTAAVEDPDILKEIESLIAMGANEEDADERCFPIFPFRTKMHLLRPGGHIVVIAHEIDVGGYEDLDDPEDQSWLYEITDRDIEICQEQALGTSSLWSMNDDTLTFMWESLADGSVFEKDNLKTA